MTTQPAGQRAPKAATSPHIRRIGEEKLNDWDQKTSPGPSVGVERTIAWLQRCRALLIRYDKRARLLPRPHPASLRTALVSMSAALPPPRSRRGRDRHRQGHRHAQHAFGSFAHNEAWLELSLVGQALLRWSALLCLEGELALAEPKRVRQYLLHPSRPGDFIGALPVNSLIHPAGLPINTSTITMLRGPVESSFDPRSEW